MSALAPHLEILAPPQLRLWEELRAGVPTTCVLYGGTALALRTASRVSEDFDWFSNSPVDAHRLREELKFLAGAELLEAAPQTATFLIDRGGPVKVSFFGGLRLGRVGEFSMCVDTQVRVASLLDLAAQKVRVIQIRAERKDYLDIATLLSHGVTLPKALGAARALYPDFAPLVTLKALSYFGDGDLDALPDDVKQRLSQAAAGVRTVETVARVSETLT